MGSSRSSVSAPENEDAGELHPSALAPGKGAQRLVHQPVGDPDRGGDLCRLGLGGVSARGVEGGVRLLVALHRAVAHIRVVAAHPGLGLPKAAYDGVETARREDPVAREHLRVARARVLREVADRSRGGDRAARREVLAGEDLGQRGLPAPLRPTRPMRSPAAIRNETSSISRRAPARTSSSDTVIKAGLSEQGFRKDGDGGLMGPGPAGYVSGGCA